MISVNPLFLLRTLTEPETVQPSISSQGSNSSILVSWSKPPGNVEYYTVHLNSTSPPEERVLSTANTSCLFESLSAGRLYSARVTTYSGPVNASSGFVSNATCKSDKFVRFSSFLWFHTSVIHSSCIKQVGFHIFLALAQSNPIWMAFINWFDTCATLGLHNSNLFFTVIFYNQVYLCHHVVLKYS